MHLLLGVWLPHELTLRAKQMNGKALHVSVDNFLNSPKYDEIVENL